MKLFTLTVLIAMTLSSLPAFTLGASTNTTQGSKHSKVIDFEDEVVEGLNKRPLDSLSQISERDRKRRKPHLYRKRAGFRAETADTIRELRYVQ